jgi:predicted 3-demethylubiquinone-9 3-methyltransferase (glyoxalase superfamily)
MAKVQKITPFLWFNGQAGQAAKFYVGIFKNSKILSVTKYPKGSPGKPGSVMTVDFELEGQHFVALNGGPQYKLSPAISFWIGCANQKEIDYYWSKLTQGGGKAVACGWLEDKFGVSWQVVPDKISRWIADPNRSKADAVLQAVWKMVKLDMGVLEKAYREG